MALDFTTLLLRFRSTQVCVSQLLYVPDGSVLIAAREQCGLFDIDQCGVTGE